MKKETLKKPRLMLTAAKSGSGKTMICCGLLQYLKRSGAAPAAFKCGPDYIDPMFHKKVLGIDSDNLDTFFSGRDEVREMVAAAEGGCVCIEGVMGLYDGASPSRTEGSCYELAEFTDTPIVLVVDARGAGRTLISVIKGILSDDSNGLVKGIILNRMTGNFYERLRPCLEEELERSGFDARVIGFLPVLKEAEFDSRHLGLKLPSETEDTLKRIDSVAEALSENCDMELLYDIMESAGELEAPDRSICRATDLGEDRAVLALAYDEAFCFYYRENLSLLEKAGLRIERFSPLRDAELPERTAGILLGGGYPELHAEELSKNTAMRTAILKAVESGMPVIAECGGFMYLHERLADAGGKEFDMVGAVKGRCYPVGHPVRFGYFELEECRDPFWSGTEGVKGHEFHYYESECCGDRCVVVKRATGQRRSCMGGSGACFWGFPHFYYASKPVMAEKIAGAVKAFADRR